MVTSTSKLIFTRIRFTTARIRIGITGTPLLGDSFARDLGQRVS